MGRRQRVLQSEVKVCVCSVSGAVGEQNNKGGSGLWPTRSPHGAFQALGRLSSRQAALGRVVLWQH